MPVLLAQGLAAQKYPQPETPVPVRPVMALPVALLEQATVMPPDAQMCLVRFPTPVVRKLASMVPVSYTHLTLPTNSRV